MLDESLDIAVHKSSIFQDTCSGKSKIEFAANVEVKDCKAETIYSAVLSYRNSKNIPMKKLSRLGTDGALVMTGCHNGFAVWLQRVNAKTFSVWFVAPKITLVARWASKAVPDLVYQIANLNPAKLLAKQLEFETMVPRI